MIASSNGFVKNTTYIKLLSVSVFCLSVSCCCMSQSVPFYLSFIFSIYKLFHKIKHTHIYLYIRIVIKICL